MRERDFLSSLLEQIPFQANNSPSTVAAVIHFCLTMEIAKFQRFVVQKQCRRMCSTISACTRHKKHPSTRGKSSFWSLTMILRRSSSVSKNGGYCVDQKRKLYTFSGSDRRFGEFRVFPRIEVFRISSCRFGPFSYEIYFEYKVHPCVGPSR
ncbi:uncharacterized protein LOC131164385 [Malania oleifera]|uniref:uncharacterized protein LOC131164385 n=1 Tax=Malania oleifera TaxID=397392 RepID=UPI0025AE03C4|nr:uncharacterized protein LOC131164385 [Malania oleifera]